MQPTRFLLPVLLRSSFFALILAPPSRAILKEEYDAEYGVCFRTAECRSTAVGEAGMFVVVYSFNANPACHTDATCSLTQRTISINSCEMRRFRLDSQPDPNSGSPASADLSFGDPGSDHWQVPLTQNEQTYSGGLMSSSQETFYVPAAVTDNAVNQRNPLPPGVARVYTLKFNFTVSHGCLCVQGNPPHSINGVVEIQYMRSGDQSRVVTWSHGAWIP